MALIIGMPVAKTSAGTMRKPPPMPKKPDTMPVASAAAAAGAHMRRSTSTAITSADAARPRSINSPTTTINAPKSRRRRVRHG